MKKKLLCGILACMMTFSSAFSLAACKPPEKPNQGQIEDNGGQTPGGENPGGQTPGEGENPGGETPGEGENPGGQTPGGENPGGQTPGGDNPGGQTPGGENPDENPDKDKEDEIAPGTVITDEETKTYLFNSLSTTEIGGLSYSASANLALDGENAFSTKISCEGFVVVDDGELKADLTAYLENEESTDRYLLFFLRGEQVYYVLGDWESEEEIDFSALKERLKSKDDPLVLEKSELPTALSEAASTTAVIKMIKNLPSLFDGVITKTEGGYSLEYDAETSIGSFFKGVGSVLESIDENHDMTLGMLFAQPYLATTLEKLLNNITAEEFKDAAEAFLPEEVAETLPDPLPKATAISYVEGLMRSGSFYEAITKGEEGWEKWKTFSAVPLEGILSLITGSEFTFGEEALADRFEDYTKDLGEQAVNYIFDLLNVESGTLSDKEFATVLRFDFDNDKKLMGFSVEALVNGTRTVPIESEEPGEDNDNPGEDNDNPGEDNDNPGDEDNDNPDGGNTNPDEGGEDGDTGDGDSDGDEDTPTPTPGEDGDDGDTGDGDSDGDDTNPDGGGEDDNNPGGNDGDGNGAPGEDGDTGDGAPGDEDTPAPDESDGGPEPEDDGADTSGPSIRTMKRASAGKKVNVKGSLKLETVSASSPELFDLTGCKYATDDGTATIEK